MAFTPTMSLIRKGGNQGIVTTTGGLANDLLHTLPTVPVTRSARIVKIVAYSVLGNIPLLIGTLDRNPAGAALVQLMPTIVALNAIESIWLEEDLPAVEFQSNRTPTAAAGRTGDIWVATLLPVQITIEVEEKF